MTVTITTHSPAQTQALAERLAKLLRPGDVLAYTGPMGAGKTTFTVGLARGLGSSDWVSSPTFALVQEYRGPVPLCHFDFYRITGVDDLYATGFFDYLDGTRVLAVEWSERIPDALPEGAIHIRFEPLENDCRRITISTPAGDDRLAARRVMFPVSPCAFLPFIFPPTPWHTSLLFLCAAAGFAAAQGVLGHCVRACAARRFVLSCA